ncbi:MAG: riboflavin synthase [Hymenobacter sp.]
MFTGIIEALGTVVAVADEGTNRHFTIKSPFAGELKIDQSVAHDGVCLTVVALDAAAGTHVVTAIDETLRKTNLGQWQPGRHLNLERCLAAGGRFDGHIVQGHVDATAECLSVRGPGWLLAVSLPPRGRPRSASPWRRAPSPSTA